MSKRKSDHEFLKSSKKNKDDTEELESILFNDKNLMGYEMSFRLMDFVDDVALSKIEKSIKDDNNNPIHDLKLFIKQMVYFQKI
jgi:hypothetical protein